MADDVELTFLQDLAAHGSPKDNDLLLVNTDGDDKTLTLNKLSQFLINLTYPVGSVRFFAQNKNPNDLFPGSTWSYIGEDKVIRLAKADGSDLMLTGGSDSATLTTENLPAHSHTFSGSTSSFDYGTKGTSENGNHSHNIHGRPALSNNPGLVGPSSGYIIGDEWNYSTGESGNHNHSVYIGTHGHTVSGNTNSVGSGTAFSLTNSFITLMAWYRTA